MVPQCYVDGDVADWTARDEDSVGCDMSGLVVYRPKMTKRQFEAWCDWLEFRSDARQSALHEEAKARGRGGLGLIDASTMAAAEQAVEARFGKSYLDEFVNDTAKVALDEIGKAFAAASASGVAMSPATAGEAIGVTPAMSFRTERDLGRYLQEGKGPWAPSVRLSMRVSAEGPLMEVEETARGLAFALAECGTVTEWRIRIRPCKGRPAAGRNRLRLVAGETKSA